jgi:hypothetical protein
VALRHLMNTAQRFQTAQSSHLQGPKCSLRMSQTSTPDETTLSSRRRVLILHWRSAIAQKNGELIGTLRTPINFPKPLRGYDLHWLVPLGWILTVPIFFTWWLRPVI